MTDSERIIYLQTEVARLSNRLAAVAKLFDETAPHGRRCGLRGDPTPECTCWRSAITKILAEKD